MRSWAPQTIEAYARDWRDFATWCFGRGLDDPLDATERDVADYTASMVRDRYAIATIRRRLAGIAFRFRIVQRRIPPTHSDLVLRVLDDAARTLRHAPGHSV